jgi:hypothetical protein
MPVRKDSPKADLRLLSFIAINRGINAVQARKLRSNLGKERTRSNADTIARINLFMIIGECND